MIGINLLVGILGIILFFFIILIFWGISIYNGLIKKRNEYKNAFSQIDVQLKRRYDLIPNLVETCKGYMKHESETLEGVISARNQAFGAAKMAAQDPSNSDAMKSLLASESSLTGALGKLMVIQEDYPDLKANENMKGLMEELSSTENKIGFARQFYNDTVTEYNNSREVFPGSLIAGVFNFIPAVLWEISEQKERENIKVSF
ncbi:MAG: LemA family protein [Halobacteriovoraceae bacterium]|nr:LemA family protein [Halobacteriovoraceae bacterium]